MNTTDTLEKFKTDANRFDWFYEMSDSHSVWQQGCAAESVILSRARAGGDDYMREWNEQHARRYNTSTFCGPYKPPFPDVWPKDAADNTIKSSKP